MTISRPLLIDTVRDIVDAQLHITAHGFELDHDADLWQLGLTSLTCLGLMLSIEDAFGIELPEEALKESTFRTISTITAAIASAREDESVAAARDS
jgi:acyl carrier protein